MICARFSFPTGVFRACTRRSTVFRSSSLSSRNRRLISSLSFLACPSPFSKYIIVAGCTTKAATINYLTNKPEPGGLFCERIFGPLQDWTCTCGKYRYERTPGFVCEKCGVEIAPSCTRRERMGHIELAAPIVHSWLARGTPSILATLLALSPRQLASVLAYSGYLVTSVDERRRSEKLRFLDERDVL